MKSLGVIMIIIGYFILGFSTIGSVGYGLYQWGSVGLELSASAWIAFVLWMKVVGGGLLLFLFGFLIGGRL